MFDFDLSLITEFDPAIVYGLQPESSCNEDSSKRPVETVLIPSVYQYLDSYQAYLYAQNTIMKAIREKGINAITPEQLISWIKELNGFLGKSILAERERKSGEYIEEEMFIWRDGSAVGNLAALCIFNPSYKNIILPQVAQLGVDSKDFEKFLIVLSKINNNDEIVVPESIQSRIKCPKSESSYNVIFLFHKMSYAFNDGKLSQDDMDIINKIVKVCPLRDNVPQLMLNYATDLLKSWNNCSTTKDDDIAALAHQAYYGLTNIHPFGNANGRTATALMNIILRSLDKPSIVLRRCGEEDDKTSPYSVAIASIDSAPDKLKKLILTRMQESSNGTAYQDMKLRKIIETRVLMAKLVYEMKQISPSFDIEKAHSIIINKVPSFILRLPNARDQELGCVQYALAEYQGLLDNLKIMNRPNKITPVVVKKYTKEEQASIIKTLEKLTETTGWKAYNAPEGLVILLEDGDINEARKISSKLNIQGVMCASTMLHAKTKTPVVKVFDVNEKKLNELIIVDKVQSFVAKTV